MNFTGLFRFSNLEHLWIFCDRDRESMVLMPWFENIDKNFKTHMKATARTKLAFKNLGNHDTWIRYKDTLSEIQK